MAREPRSGKFFLLNRILETGSLGGLCIGDDDQRLQTILGPPPVSPSRLGRRSTLWAWSYGNVTLLTVEHRIVDIQLNFERRPFHPVQPGPLARWVLSTWQARATREGWQVDVRDDVIVLHSAHARIFLDLTGELHTVTLLRTR